MSEEILSLEKELASLERFGLLRNLKKIHSACEPEVDMEGRKVLQFSSNNYLGLATHPKVKEAAVQATLKYGTGAGASRLISGNYDLLEDLEAKLAVFKGTEAALVYATGSMANLGVLSCLIGSGDLILLDEFDHATLHDGARLSRAKVVTFKHNDLADLERILEEHKAVSRKLIAVDGVFSMDGDLFPLPGLVELAKKYQALTLVDDAHGTGVVGRNGKGSLEHFELASDQIDLQVGTLSKALGSLGGFVACSARLRQFLVNKSRSFLFATALAPANAAAALAALQLIQEDAGFREKLWENRSLFLTKTGGLALDTCESVTPIVPIKLGRPENAMQAQKALWEEGIYVPAIRPPTVPRNASRLRISLMSTHQTIHIERLVKALNRICLPRREQEHAI